MQILQNSSNNSNRYMLSSRFHRLRGSQLCTDCCLNCKERYKFGIKLHHSQVNKKHNHWDICYIPWEKIRNLQLGKVCTCSKRHPCRQQNCLRISYTMDHEHKQHSLLSLSRPYTLWWEKSNQNSNQPNTQNKLAHFHILGSWRCCYKVRSYLNGPLLNRWCR
jgi:hypothetical protein